MKATRILSAYSIPRDDQDFSPECISYIEEADETDIPPEQFIASILTSCARLGFLSLRRNR